MLSFSFFSALQLELKRANTGQIGENKQYFEFQQLWPQNNVSLQEMHSLDTEASYLQRCNFLFDRP